MLEFHEARRRLLALPRRLGPERVDLRHACGRVLVGDVTSPVDIPGFSCSAMDGYAVRFESLPVDPIGSELPVLGESRAGLAGPDLCAASAQRIFTGARLPTGADTVIIQENVERQGGSIRLGNPVRLGDHVRHVGEDVRRGEIVLAAGTRLGPFHLGLLASLDRTTVEVARKPHVSVLCTGDELREPGSSDNNAVIGSLPESNGIAIAALAEAAGAHVTLFPLGPDRVEALVPLVRDALACSDVLVTIGGVSVGDYDVVQAALQQAGVTIDFYKVRMRPGKPLLVGRYQDKLTLGLPGNPVSAQVTASLFLLPLLRTLQGDSRTTASFVKRRLGAPFKHSPGRRGFFRATVDGDEVTLQTKQGSGSVLSMATANALVTFDEDSTGAVAGELVDTILLSDL